MHFLPFIVKIAFRFHLSILSLIYKKKCSFNDNKKMKIFSVFCLKFDMTYDKSLKSYTTLYY